MGVVSDWATELCSMWSPGSRDWKGHFGQLLEATTRPIFHTVLVGLVLAHLDLDLHTHTHPFNGPLPGTTRVSRYQKGKTSLDFTEARDSEWQWHQLCHMQVCTLLQTDNHANTPSLIFYRPDVLPATQLTASKH